jgi:uncharacterized membrane protein YkoI
MILQRTILTGILLVSAAGAANAAAEHCLTRAEQRAKTAAHAVVPLSRAMHAVRKHGEVIHVRLCESGGHLVYLLTVLAHDGKVAEASIDAVNGAVIAAHAQDQAGQDVKQDNKQDVKPDVKKAK